MAQVRDECGERGARALRDDPHRPVGHILNLAREAERTSITRDKITKHDQLDPTGHATSNLFHDT